MGNINYLPPKKLTPWRKLSLASWEPKGDSSIYAMEDIILDKSLDFCRREKISIYPLLIQSVSMAIKDHPQVNSSVIRNRIIPRKDISVFFHVVNRNNDDDLSGVRLTNPHEEGMQELNTLFVEKVEEAANGEGPYVASKKVVAKTPRFLVKPLLNLYSYFAYKWNRNLKFFKSPDDAFGSVMMTAVGSVGITKALCPIAPYTHVPMVISVGKIESRPVVIENAIEIRQVATLGFTFDHRIMEGIHFKAFFESFKSHLNHLSSN